MQKIIYALFILSIPLFTVIGQEKKELSGKSLFGGMNARQIGPAITSGRVSTLDVVSSDPKIIYVGGGGGGVWKSNSAGSSFRPVFDDHIQSIGKIEIDQNHPDTVWVGTGEPWPRNSVSIGNGIYKSTNGGSEWNLMGLENTERIADIIIHPKNPNVVYVAAMGKLWAANEERGIFKTTDGGKTWEKIFYIDENTGCTDLDIDPENPDILYAAMWSYRRWPWSFDSGFTGTSGFFKSTDGGGNWKMMHNGLPQDTLGRMAIAVAPSEGNTIYLTVEAKDKEDKGLYKSTDAGKSWDRINNDFNVTVRPFYFSNMTVDPNDEDVVLKCGFNFIISEDGGERFRTVGSAVHSDIHDAWVDPNNSNHMIIGTDGGVYESYDKGYTFKMFMNLPLSQFYRISVDMDQPYNVYGGLQDNGSWYAPSQKSGGIANGDWEPTFGGDGFYSFRHPKDENIVFAEYQGGNLVRYNKTTGRAKDIKPFPENAEEKYRFNWNTPIHLSPNDDEKMYFAAQYLFSSKDRGDTWKIISPDLTTNDPEKQKQSESGGLSIDNSTAENHCSIYAVAESPKDQNIIWVGTDDGNLQVTSNGGKKWKNVVKNIEGLPKNTWVTDVEPSHFDANTAYVTFDGHRTGDNKTYVYKTADGGKSWTSIVSPVIEGYALCIAEDLKNPNLIFLGTEFGLFISLDGGGSWTRFENNVPKVGVRDMVIHPRDDALVLGTHGRGCIILDDISPLRQYSQDMLEEKVYFFEPKPTILRDPGAGSGWFGGAGNFVGSNPSSSANIIYYMSKRHTFGKSYVEVYDADDKLIKTLPAGKSAGINIVQMPTFLKKPKAAPTNNRTALFSSLFGPSLDAGKYKVKYIKGKEEYVSSFELKNDPSSPYSDEDRRIQRKATFQLYDLTQELAYIYDNLISIEKHADEKSDETGAVKDQLAKLSKEAKELAGSLVALEGDGYVDAGERINERVSDLYRLVSSFPGKPSGSQLDRIDNLQKDFDVVEQKYNSVLESLKSVNTGLEAEEINAIDLPTFEEFLERE